MYDPERGWSLSFSGCGFLGFYHVGATRCLSERAPHLLRDARMFFGCSAGALHGVTFLAGVPIGESRAPGGGAGTPDRVARAPWVRAAGPPLRHVAPRRAREGVGTPGRPGFWGRGRLRFSTRGPPGAEP